MTTGGWGGWLAEAADADRLAELLRDASAASHEGNGVWKASAQLCFATA